MLYKIPKHFLLKPTTTIALNYHVRKEDLFIFLKIKFGEAAFQEIDGLAIYILLCDDITPQINTAYQIKKYNDSSKTMVFPLQ